MSKAIPRAYARLRDAEYMEVFGLDFERFEAGQRFRHRPGITVSAQDITDECLDTLNAAQIHYDANYAANTEFARPLGVSTLTLQKCFGLCWKTFARKDRILSFRQIEMKRPVFAGTTLYAETEILELREDDDLCGVVTARLDALDENSNTLANITFDIRVYRHQKHPYYGRMDAEFDGLDDRFAAFATADDGAWVEQTGLFFDDFEVGEIFHHRPEKFVGAAEALEHARRSMDWNPRFTSPNFAKDHFNDGSSPLTELYSIGALTASTTRTLGRVVANLEWKNVNLRRLVYPGESFRTATRIIDKKSSRSRPEQGILTVTTTARDADDAVVLTYDRVLLVYRAGCGPYSDGEY